MTATASQDLSLLSIKDDQVTWTKDQKTALIDVLRVRHATEADLAVFFHQARRTGLDPFARQLYLIAREEWDKEARAKVWRQTFQTGIDGFRVVARRRADRMGVTLSYDDAIYFAEDGRESTIWPDEAKAPLAVRVTVRLGDGRFPFTAYFKEYVPMIDEYEGEKGNRKPTGRKVPTSMWQQRPLGQLEKCAEAGALRRACPQDLSGIYEFSEMERDRSEQPVTTLVDDGSGKPVAKKASGRTKGQLLWHIKRGPDRGALSALWQEAKDNGWLPDDEIEQALRARAEKLQKGQPEAAETDPERIEPARDESAGPPRECIHGHFENEACHECEALGGRQWMPLPGDE